MADTDRSTVLPCSVPSWAQRGLFIANVMAEACVTCRLPARGRAFLCCLWDTIDNYLDTIFVSRCKQLNAGY